jgi:putative chitinase
MLVTREQLAKFFDHAPAATIDNFLEPLNKTLEHFEINNTQRIAMFMAQIGHESGGLKFLEENLNYRADRLVVIFPRHFRDVDPNQYGRNPEKIANRVYANRMGNGPESSGDGWRYRGRGLIQLTGHDNYARFAADMGMSVEDAVQYLTTHEGAAMSAGWFWGKNNLNATADRGDIVANTKRINGGTIGLADRQAHYEEALHIFV